MRGKTTDMSHDNTHWQTQGRRKKRKSKGKRRPVEENLGLLGSL
jgi:hypothetical protein